MSFEQYDFKIFENLSQQIIIKIKIFHVFRNHYDVSLLFVTHDDKVYGFGCNRFGRLGFGHENNIIAPQEPQELVALSGKRVEEFFVGTDFVLALNGDLTLYSWGWNKYGQLGRGLSRNGCYEPGLIDMSASSIR